MEIQTFNIIAGSMACNARCPGCIAGITPALGIESEEPEVNWRNFRIACRLAESKKASTAFITGKGEPTIFPEQITKFIEVLSEYNFPLKELQTNGILLAGKPDFYLPHLKKWYELGMTTIAVSIIHYLAEKNRQIYLPHKDRYIDLPRLIRTLHAINGKWGFSVRLCCVMAKGYIDSVSEVKNMIDFARENKAEQLTLTPVSKPEESGYSEVENWVGSHRLSPEELDEIGDYLYKRGRRWWRLAHGAILYDVAGQNVCLNNCLKVNPDSEELRNLIFYPDGHLRAYWQYPGSIIL